MFQRWKAYLGTTKGTMAMLLFVALLLGTALGAGATTNAIRAASEQIYTVSQGELRVYVTILEEEIGEVQGDLNEIVQNYWFTAGNSQQIVIRDYELVTELREIRMRHEWITYMFCVSDERPERCWVGYDPDQISYKESSAVKEALRGSPCLDQYTRETRVLTLNGEAYLAYWVSAIGSKEHIGVLYRVDDILDRLRNDGEMYQDYLVDAELNFYGMERYEQNCTDQIGEERIFAEQTFYVGNHAAFAVGSREKDFYLVRMVDAGDIFRGLSKSYWIFGLMAVLLALMNPLIRILLDRRVYKPLDMLLGAMKEMQKDNLGYRMTALEKSSEFEYLQNGFNSMVEEIQHLRIRAYEEEIERLQIEATNLRLQVSPHMLQNSLNIIYNLSLSGNHKVIQQFVPCLSDYFRYSLERHGELVLLADEIRFVDNYLKVQKIRFPDRILFVYNVSEDLLNVKIPPLLIQNFVENTVKYGLKPDEETEIILVAAREEERISISIIDTGSGIRPEILDKLQREEPYRDERGEHIGIWNCRRRLTMIYGEQAKLSITSEYGQGTQIWIQMPVSKGEDE